MREKAVSGMMAAHKRDRLESAMAVDDHEKISEPNQGAYIIGPKGNTKFALK